MSTKKPSLLTILSETSQIITTHFRQFLTLSILFILPNSIATIIYPFLSQPPSLHHLRLLSDDSPPYSTPTASPQLPIQFIFILIIFLVCTYLFNLCTVTSITYTTFHGFHREPVDLFASLKSILVSFFPLIATSLVLETIFILITFVFIFLALVSYNGLALLGLQVDYYGTNFLIIVLGCMLFFYLLVELYLVNAVVILESKWGFAPLKRSWYLVKGMRGVIFLVMMLFTIPSLLFSVWFMSVVADARIGLTAWIVLQAVVYVGFSVMLQVYAFVSNTVVFVHCKAIHEESAFQIDDVPGLVYVQLPSDVV